MSSKQTAREPKEKKRWNVITRQQLAELVGVHPDTITDFARQGMPVLTMGGRGKESAYDAIDCLAWWRKKQGKNLKEAAQTRAYEAQAKLNEQKLKVQTGLLLPRDEVERAGQTYTKAWTSMVRALPRQLVQAGVLQREMEHRANDLVRSVLVEISNWRNVGDAKASERRATAA